MSIAEIKKLREERKHFIEKYTKELESVRKDTRISESYREEKVLGLLNNLEDVKRGHDQRIRELIKKGKDESLRKVEMAEFEGLNEKQLLTKLIVENRNRDKAAVLEELYKGDINTLLSEATKALNVNSQDVPAYVQALQRLSKNEPIYYFDIDRIEQTYKQNNLNALQKDYYKDYEAYVSQEKEYTQEIAQEQFIDAFSQ